MENVMQSDSIDKFDLFMDKLANIVFEIMLSEKRKVDEQHNRVA